LPVNVNINITSKKSINQSERKQKITGSKKERSFSFPKKKKIDVFVISFVLSNPSIHPSIHRKRAHGLSQKTLFVAGIIGKRSMVCRCILTHSPILRLYGRIVRPTDYRLTDGFVLLSRSPFGFAVP